MARSGVIVVAVLVLAVMATSPVTAGRAKRVLSFAIRAWCIPKTESLLLEHDARRECAYDLRNGDRAVGVRYNLDDDIETRRSELSTVLADYEKVTATLQRNCIEILSFFFIVVRGFQRT